MPDLDAPTVADLLHGGLLSGATVTAGAELQRRVVDVHIVDDVHQLAGLRAGSAVVLTEHASHGEWRLELTLRKAWERAAACVIAPASAVRSDAPALVAERLRVPLVAVATDPYAVALALARSVGSASTPRADVLADCATGLSEIVAVTPARILRVLDATIPGASFAWLAADGHPIAGREVPGPDENVVRRRLPAPDVTGSVLIAHMSVPSTGLAATVRIALGIAAPMLAAVALGDRLDAERRDSVAAGVLQRLLAGEDGEGLRAEAAAYGWPLHPPIVPLAVTSIDDASVPDPVSVASAWSTTGASPMLIRYDSGWVCWRPPSAGGPTLEAALARMRPVAELVGGIGPTVTRWSDLRDGLDAALRAAVFARHGGVGHVEQAERIGPAVLLGALPRTQLDGAARQALSGLLELDTDGSLLRTLAALLDNGGATRQVATQLGVHRNTVTARALRLRRMGLDVNDMPDRLAVHLACHLLLRS